jgi:hypothetical protein
MQYIDYLRTIQKFLIDNTNYKISNIKFWEMQGVDSYSHFIYINEKGLFGKKIGKVEYYEKKGKVDREMTVELLKNYSRPDEIKKLDALIRENLKIRIVYHEQIV